jgi:hypothetical protein
MSPPPSPFGGASTLSPTPGPTVAPTPGPTPGPTYAFGPPSAGATSDTITIPVDVDWTYTFQNPPTWTNNDPPTNPLFTTIAFPSSGTYCFGHSTVPGTSSIHMNAVGGGRAEQVIGGDEVIPGWPAMFTLNIITEVLAI